jgi:hypothetical protein
LTQARKSLSFGYAGPQPIIRDAVLFAMRPLLLLLLLAIVVPAALAQSVRLGAWRVEKERAQVKLVWQTEAEAGVQSYEVRRRAPTSGSEFLSLGDVRSHGAGRTYDFTDDDLYKNAQAMAQYQVWVVFTNGVRQPLFTAEVNYTSTGLRRTWGSLKAMFQ